MFDAIGDFFTGGLLKVALPVLATVGAGIVVKMLNAQLQRVGLSLTQEQDAAMRKKVREIIMSVEERAEAQKKVDAQFDSDKARAVEHASDRKRADAVRIIAGELRVGADRADTLLHQELPKLRPPDATPRPVRTATFGGPAAR